MKLFAFDRDETLDVNPPVDRQAVPLRWVQVLAHESDHEVWAIGNQRLREEADIPGMDELLDAFPGTGVASLTRERRLRLLAELFPRAETYVVVDDIDLSHVDGWTHYYPWDFVAAVESDAIDLDLPRRERPDDE